MMFPKISIITICWNSADHIVSALRSVLQQTYENFEYIIQDGCSTDGTLDIVARHADPRMRVFSEPDAGIYDALNKAISKATGDIIGIVHADDFLASPTVLEKVAQVMADPSVDGVYGDLEYVLPDNPDSVIRYWRAGEYTPKLLKRGWMPPHPTLYLRREVYEQWGAFDTSYAISGDYEAILRWLVRGKIRLHYIPEVLVKMRLGGTSNRLRNLWRKDVESLRAMRHHGVGGLPTLAMKYLRKLDQFFVRR